MLSRTSSHKFIPQAAVFQWEKEYYPSSSIRKGVGVEKWKERDLSNENTLSESLLW